MDARPLRKMTSGNRVNTDASHAPTGTYPWQSPGLSRRRRAPASRPPVQGLQTQDLGPRQAVSQADRGVDVVEGLQQSIDMVKTQAEAMTARTVQRYDELNQRLADVPKKNRSGRTDRRLPPPRRFPGRSHRGNLRVPNPTWGVGLQRPEPSVPDSQSGSYGC